MVVTVIVVVLVAGGGAAVDPSVDPDAAVELEIVGSAVGVGLVVAVLASAVPRLRAPR